MKTGHGGKSAPLPHLTTSFQSGKKNIPKTLTFHSFIAGYVKHRSAWPQLMQRTSENGDRKNRIHGQDADEKERLG